ncbi:two-component regulator propeller domain-containing protein [Marispirochaeta aestuarii]|uniref:ligand-binding sensor domain-containing protein n=1 Tax=Marispirochaeta aestuarii TaxID=1963862 RepID=UPI0029C67211|nr:two-component regulator propeller domain-containing protein [Marispirochaeta aestuarii]
MKKTMLLVLLGVLLAPVPQYAEEPMQFIHLSLREGLSNNSVFAVYQDYLGFMWFGTFSGLNRYDGRNIQVFKPEQARPESISGSVIFDIFEDSRQRLWIGTDGGGLNRYDFSDGSFSVYQAEPGNPNSLPSQKVFCLEEDSAGRIWIGTGDAGIAIFLPETEQFIRYSHSGIEGLESDVIRVLLGDSRDRMWIGTQGGGLSLFRDGFSLNNFFDKSTVREVFEDSLGRIWVGLENEGLYVADSASGAPSFRQVFGEKSVRCIAEDDFGTIWAGTERSGLVLVDGDYTTRTVVHDQNNDFSLSSDFIRDIYVDKSGIVWVATRGGGVDRYNPRARGFTYLLQGGYDVRKILESGEGDLWITTDGQGLLRMDRQGTLRHYLHSESDPQGINSNHLYSLAEDPEGNIWIGSDGDGLMQYRRRDGRFLRYYADPDNPSALSSNVVWALQVDREGYLWIGTEGGGLNRFLPEENRFERFMNIPGRPESLLGNSIRALYEDSAGNLWIGTWDGGLSMKIRGEDRFRNYTRDPGDPRSLSDNSVNCISEDGEGNLWVGTSGGGLNRFDREKGSFHAFRVQDGLSDDNVFGILPDDSGFLWVSTANGLSRFDLITEQITNLWRSDGTLSNQFGRNAYFRSSDGNLLFGTARGLLSFDPEKIHVNSYSPDIRITGFSLFNEEIPVGLPVRDRVYLERNICLTESLTIYPGDSFIGFSFASLDYADSGKNKYAVRLNGFDTDWHYLRTENTFYYSSLPPGSYMLQVMGTNSNGVWSNNYADLEITVVPPFYQTWYFALLMGGLLVSVFFVIGRIRIAGLDKRNRMLQQFSNYVQDIREEERKAIARDVHDELGQLLTTLKMHIFWLSRNAASMLEQRQARYESMLGIINETLDWSKDLATRLRPVILDNLSLGEAVDWLLDETERHSSLRFQRSVGPTPEMNVERATAVFRIIQETVTNIVRHSNAASASLSLMTNEGILYVTVHDDGVGMAKNKLTDAESYGIIGMQERAKHLGGEISIHSTPLGTTVFLRVPVTG